MKRHMLLAALTSVAVLSVAAPAAAQTAGDYPNRPIRIIVPQAAGSGIDIHARILAQKMGELLGQPGVVENRPGANAIIGTDAVAKAAPDGYTLVYAPVSSITTNAFIYKKLPYNPLRDFAPITQTTANPLGAVANPASGIKSLKDIVARAKAEPGKLNYGSFGVGNMTHLMGVLLSLAADIKMTHVPYRGQTPEITDIMAGTDSIRLHDHGRHGGPRGNGKAQPDLPPSARSATSSFPTRRRRPRKAFRAWSWWAGAACSRRPGRRRRSSTNCTPRWRRRWRCPTSRP